jgi:hypothetical protein
MSTAHDEAQRLARKVYLEARRIVLKELGGALKRLDEIYGADAAKLKGELRRVLARSLAQSGVAPSVIDKAIDGVLSGSRASRVAVIEAAIVDAAKAARKLDEATFTEVFGPPSEAATAGPFVRAQSGLRPQPMRWLRLVRESEDPPQSTD